MVYGGNLKLKLYIKKYLKFNPGLRRSLQRGDEELSVTESSDACHYLTDATLHVLEMVPRLI